MAASVRIRRVLILGGTAEARILAERLAARCDLAVTLSLAGRTAQPLAQAVPLRVGGFGGADGLADYLRRERIDIVIDATHPFAAAISANAAHAAQQIGAQLIALRRPEWPRLEGDDWHEIGSLSEAVRVIGQPERRIFLAIGRKGLAAFERAPQHCYLIRSVDPVDPPLALPHATYITARGPFGEGEERDLLERHAIQLIVAKNSGGDATYAKIAAARALRLPVIMLKRPALPHVESAATVDGILAWLDHASTPADARGV